jgi:hypothetical protein
MRSVFPFPPYARFYIRVNGEKRSAILRCRVFIRRFPCKRALFSERRILRCVARERSISGPGRPIKPVFVAVIRVFGLQLVG